MTDVSNIEDLKSTLVSALADLGLQLAGFMPKLLAMLAILLIGWGIARAVQAVTAKILVSMKLDQAAGYLGLNEVLANAGIKRPASALISRLLFWLLILAFVLPATETLGLTSVTTTINRLIAFLPNVIAATLILLLGLLLARFLGNVVSSGAAFSAVPYSRQLGQAARGVMIVMVSVVAIEQLGIKTSLFQWSLVATLAAVVFAMAFAFAMGSKEVVGGILAGYYLRKSLLEGTSVEVLGRSGTLTRIGATDTLFRSGDKNWSIPNQQLLGAVIERDANGRAKDR